MQQSWIVLKREVKPCLQSVILCVGFSFFLKAKWTWAVGFRGIWWPWSWSPGWPRHPTRPLASDQPRGSEQTGRCQTVFTITSPHLSTQMSLMTGNLSAASLSRPDTAPSLHEHGETTSEGEREAQETSEESGGVSALFTPAPLPVIGVQFYSSGICHSRHL